jgi:competence protein ComEC
MSADGHDATDSADDAVCTGLCDGLDSGSGIGTIDLFMVSHHGFAVSNSSALLQALQPRVFLMNNATRKGGEAQVLDRIRTSPRVLDLWQLHASGATGARNAALDFIANPEDPCQAKALRISARPDGAFTVTNMRNNFGKTYAP